MLDDELRHLGSERAARAATRGDSQGEGTAASRASQEATPRKNHAGDDHRLHVPVIAAPGAAVVDDLRPTRGKGNEAQPLSATAANHAASTGGDQAVARARRGKRRRATGFALHLRPRQLLRRTRRMPSLTPRRRRLEECEGFGRLVAKRSARRRTQAPGRARRCVETGGGVQKASRVKSLYDSPACPGVARTERRSLF